MNNKFVSSIYQPTHYELMENDGQNNKTVTYALSALAALLLIGGVYFWNKSGNLTRQNDQIEQRADSLLSVKLQLEGDIRGLNSQIETASTEKASLNERVEALNTQLANQNRAVAQLRQSNQGRTRTIKGLNRNIAVITTKRDSLESQMEAVQNKITWLTDANTKLTSQNDELSPPETGSGRPQSRPANESAPHGTNG